MPAYNCEKTIGRTIESVLAQSYQNFELIIVNDGSTDSTAAICSDYEQKDSRIRVLIQENMGPATARNLGIQEAKGEYISFIDADDTYKPEFLKNMISAIEDTKADFAMCGFDKIRKDSIITVLPPLSVSKEEESEYVVKDSIFFLRLFFEGCMNGEAALWNKVYHSDIFTKYNIRLEDLRKHGDWKFNLDLLTSDNIKGVILKTSLYNYYETSGSLTKIPNTTMPTFTSAKLMLDINSLYKLEYEDIILGGVIRALVSYVLALTNVGCNCPQCVDSVKRFRENPIAAKALQRLWVLPESIKIKFLATLCVSGRPGIWLFQVLCKLR